MYVVRGIDQYLLQNSRLYSAKGRNYWSLDRHELSFGHKFQNRQQIKIDMRGWWLRLKEQSEQGLTF